MSKYLTAFITECNESKLHILFAFRSLHSLVNGYVGYLFVPKLNFLTFRQEWSHTITK